MIRGLVPTLSLLVHCHGHGLLRLTLDLFKALAVQSSDSIVLFFKASDTTCQGNSDLELLIVQLIRAIGFVIFKGSFHLFDRLNNLVRLLSEFIFLAVNLDQITRPWESRDYRRT